MKSCVYFLSLPAFLLAAPAWAEEGVVVLGSAESAGTVIDLVHQSTAVETNTLPTITFELFPEISGVTNGTAQIRVNGEVVAETATTDSYSWTPSAYGYYEVEHRVLLHDVVNGTTRTMTYECWATNLIVSRTDLPLKKQFPTKYAEVKNVAIASGASSICADLFKDCIALETVTLPSGIVAIGKGAFAGCGNVVSINVPRLEDWMLTSIVDDADDPVRNGAALLVDGEPLAGRHECLRLRADHVYGLLAAAVPAGPRRLPVQWLLDRTDWRHARYGLDRSEAH